MSYIDKNGIWVLILGTPFCISCKFMIAEVEDKIPFEYIDIHDPKNKHYLEKYEIESVEDIPTLVVYKGSDEIYRTCVPISIARINQIAGIVNKYGDQ